MGIWTHLDPYLVIFYRQTGVQGLDSFIGTFVLALAVVVIGEFTLTLVFRANRKHLAMLDSRLKKYGDLSQEALRRGDAESYQALNRQANDAYGHVFFNKFGLSAAALWPIFFALDWMQPRFSETGIAVPFYPSGVNYVVAFRCCYVLARILVGHLKKRLPYFRGQHAMLRSCGKSGLPSEEGPPS
jgi:hypothetical protein